MAGCCGGDIPDELLTEHEDDEEEPTRNENGPEEPAADE
jgi:hypothetical protein